MNAAPNTHSFIPTVSKLRLKQSYTHPAQEYHANDCKNEINDQMEQNDYNPISKTSHDDVLLENGYKKLRKMNDTLQGSVFEAELVKDSNKIIKQKYCIKQTNKSLHHNKESIQDGLSVIVEQNIIKEAVILKYLTNKNQPKGEYITKYIDFFESQTDYYLVMEYHGQYNLSQFITKCHQYIKQKKLKLNHFKKIMKFIFWQIVSMINWMHDDMNCVHLDLCMENIIVSDNALIIDDDDNTVKIDPCISVKIADFGLSEIYSPQNETFICDKWGLKDSYQYSSPALYDEIYYNAKKEDVWSLGIILYKMLTGNQNKYCLYNLPNIDVDKHFYFVQNHKIDVFIKMNHLQKYFNQKIINLLHQTLTVDEDERISTINILKSGYFESYYRRYGMILKQKSIQQKMINKRQIECGKMNKFPYYSMK